MSRRDDLVGLGDVLSHAREAIDLLGERSREDLARDRVIQLALTRLMEIAGEAANRVSRATQQTSLEIPWAQVVSMRNRLIHGYDVIDLDLLWETVRHELPPLVEALREIVEES